MKRYDVLVVGGGISGLASAWWLARSGLSVGVWEADERPGGKIQTTRQGAFVTERAASMVLNFRPEVSELVAAAGLEPLKTRRQPAAEARRYLLHRQGLQALPMRPAALIASPIWSLKGKLRLLAEPFVWSSARAGETVSQFITRRLGKEVLDKAMEPFVAGTLAADPDQTCAVSALPRLVALERRFGSLAVGMLASRMLKRRTANSSEVFSFQGGMSALVDRLAANPGIGLVTGCTVRELMQDGVDWRVTGSTALGEQEAMAREVIVAAPAPAAAGLVQELDEELAGLLRGIEYAPLALVHTGFAREAIAHALDGAGFLAPRAESAVLTGNLWMSSLFPDRAPPGGALVTSYLGGARFPGAIDWSEEQLLDQTLRTLRPLLGIRGAPEMLRIDRHPQALPLYHGAYARRMLAIDARLKGLAGLHLEANYRGGVSVRDRLARGHALAQRILSARHWAARDTDATRAKGETAVAGSA